MQPQAVIIRQCQSQASHSSLVSKQKNGGEHLPPRGKPSFTLPKTEYVLTPAGKILSPPGRGADQLSMGKTNPTSQSTGDV